MDRKDGKLYKVLFIGDATVGKTSFIQNYVRKGHARNYKATVGVDFSIKILKADGKGTLRLQLWDIAGQDRYTSMTRVYYKDAHAGVIMFDLTSRESFNNIARWKKDFDSKCKLPDGNSVPCILLGNKCDLTGSRQVAAREVELLCRRLCFLGWNETSASEGIRMEQSMSFLVDEMLKKTEQQQSTTPAKDRSNVRLTLHSHTGETFFKCVC